MTEAALLTILLATSAGAPPAGSDTVNSISKAPHSIVLEPPPHLVAVPGSPVQHAPGVDFNLFAYAGRYYSVHNGAWFSAAAYHGTWTRIAPDRVPPAVRAVPAAYYKIPPSHVKPQDGNRKPTGRR